MGAKQKTKSSKMLVGIGIALFGGLMATGFSLANAVGVDSITKATLEAGNPSWCSSVVIMVIIYVCGAIYVLPYFAYQLCKSGTWSKFRTPHLGRNISLITVMAIFNFVASVMFAYAAFNLGNAGNTIGYAVYNTTSVLLAVVGGLIAREWVSAPAKSKWLLFIALVCMIGGVTLIAVGNSF